MLQKIISWFRGVIYRMLHINDAKQVLKTDVAIGAEMQSAIDLWSEMFQGRAGWLNRNTQSLGLPSVIAGEAARLVTVEFKSEITGSARAEYLQGEYRHVLDRLRVNTEIACAGGGLAFKPYVDSGHIVVDCVPAWRFLPTAYNSRGEVTSAVFVEQAVKGKTYYTRMEQHELSDKGYTIRNYAFQSSARETLGTPCTLSEVDEWASLEPEVIIHYTDDTALDRPLFSYFRLPFANTVDSSSPLGVSIYSRAVGLIEQADKQYSRILWEYEGSELAVDASEGAIRPDCKLPERRKRLFRELGIDSGSGGDLYQVFSPAIRDSSLFNGLNQLLRRIELNCYLSYGTLSDPNNVDKTATEIRSSKQRSYSAICDIQQALERALDQLIWAMDVYASLYSLAPAGEYEVSYTWGDGVLEDTDVEFVRYKALADGGYISKAYFLSWWLGIPEEEAAKMIPQEEKSIEFDEE